MRSLELRVVAVRGRGRRYFGVTLLEIMVALAVMAVVLIAFASVFPAGLRLNLSTMNQSRAAAFATSVAEQLANQPVSVLQDASVTGMLATTTSPQTFLGPAVAGWTVRLASGVQQRVVTLPSGLRATSQTGTNIFWLDNVTLTNPWLSPHPTPAAFATASPTLQGVVTNEERYIDLVQIVVTVSWKESRKSGAPIPKSVTVTALTNSVMSL